MSGAAKDVRLGVVGVGIMGSNHARVLADLPGVKLVGIADPAASHRELLAQVVGCAVGTVKSRLSRARAALRQRLRDYAT